MKNWTIGILLGLISAAAAAAPATRLDSVVVKGSAKIGASTDPNAKAVLDLESTTKGLLPPRMTQAQRDAIATPPAGLIIFNTTTAQYDAYSGSAWVAVGSALGNVSAPSSSSAFEVSSTTAGVLIPRMTTTQRDAISSPATGLLIYNTSTVALNQYNGTTWTAVGSGGGTGQGGINYLVTSSSSSNSDLEAGVGDWLAYADAAGAAPVDGTGGSPTLTCTRTTSIPLRGTGSLLVTKDAANRQGQGCAVPFTIDRADLAKPLMVEIDYEVASGTYDVGSDSTDPDLVAYVYGPTDGTPQLFQLAPYKILGGTTGTQLKFQGRFQTAASGVAYRLILHEAKTGTSAYTVKADNLKVGPEQKSFGPPITDETTYTPTLNNGGTTSVNTARWKRVGGWMEIEGSINFTGAGSASRFSVTLPSGYSVDTARLSSAGTGSNVPSATLGTAFWFDSGTNYKVASAKFDSTTTFSFINDAAGDVINGNAFASGDTVNYLVRFPITGWLSTVQMSNDTDTRVVAGKATLSTNQTGIATATLTKVTFNSAVYDKAGVIDTANTRLTATVPGIYDIKVTIGWSVTTGLKLVGYRKNGVATDYYIGTITGSDRIAASTEVQLVAGDYIEIYARQDSGSAGDINAGETNTFVTFSRKSGPSQIAATDTIAVSAYRNAALITGTGGWQDLVIDTKSFDTTDSFNTSTGVFTSRISGKFHALCAARFPSAAAAAIGAAILVGSTIKGNTVGVTNTTSGVSMVAAKNLSLSAGDTVKCQIYASSAYSMTVGEAETYLSIERIGN